MFPLLPFHGRELAQLYGELARRVACTGVARRVGDIGAALILLVAIAVGLYALLELVPLSIVPPRPSA